MIKWVVRPLLAGVLLAATLVPAFAQQQPAANPPPAMADDEAAAPDQTPGTAPQTAPARNGPGRQAIVACRGDMQTLCGGVAGGAGRKIACLKENQAKLSPECHNAILAVLDAPGVTQGQSQLAVRQACQADVSAVCANVEKGQGRIIRCLKENEAKLSPGCRTAIADGKLHNELMRRTMREACKNDRQALCGPDSNGPAAVQCLRSKQSQLSAGCQQALAGMTQR